jgi:hypothetical protein
MPQKYLHYFGNEASESLLEAYGIVTKDRKLSDALRSKQCPRRWLIDEKLEQYRHAKMIRPQTTNSTTIRWIEKLLQTPLDDYRKFVVWRMLAPYLINIRKCSADEASNIIRGWLDRCRNLRQLDFTPNYIIKYNINSAKRNNYLPKSLEKLKVENPYLYNVLAKS